MWLVVGQKVSNVFFCVLCNFVFFCNWSLIFYPGLCFTCFPYCSVCEFTLFSSSIPCIPLAFGFCSFSFQFLSCVFVFFHLSFDDNDLILSLQFFTTVLHSSLFCLIILCMFQTKHWCCWNMRSLTLTGKASESNPANRRCFFFYAANWRQSLYLTGNLLQHVVLLEHAVPYTDRHSICTESSQ